MVRISKMVTVASLGLLLSACGGKGMIVPDEHVRTRMPAGQGVIFADKRGGSVAMTLRDGTHRQLADGTPVATSETLDESAAGPRQRVRITLSDGVEGIIDNTRLLTEQRLVRLPDKTVGLFSALDRCQGPICRTEVWVLRAGGHRVRATRDADAAISVAWRLDSKQVAIGSRGLHVVGLDDLKVSTLHDFTSPAYASDGTLYVRGRGGNDAVYRLGGEITVVAELPGAPPRPAGATAAPEPAPVRFEAGTIVAEFLRPDGVKVLRVRR